MLITWGRGHVAENDTAGSVRSDDEDGDEDDDDDNDNSNDNNDDDETASSDSSRSNITSDESINESPSIESNRIFRLDEVDLKVYSIDELLKMAKDNKFPPKKVILFGKTRKTYTQVLHFFNHTQEFNKRPNHLEF